MEQEIKKFLTNLNQYSKFERIKKIYDFTDKLNPFLVTAFLEEYKEYSESLVSDLKQISGIEKFTNDIPSITIEKDDNGNYNYFIEGQKQGIEVEETLIQIIGAFRYESDLDTIEAKSTTDTEPEPLDLSDTSAVEKIIYLNELGVIDFLRTKTKMGVSNGGLASVLSGITGIKAETIKPSLNRLSNNDIIDNKHPYYTTKTVDKIKTLLIKLGF